MFVFFALALFHLAPTTAQAPPYREPQIASSPTLVALAFGSGKSIYVATSTDHGQKFSEPVKVTEAGILPLSRHRGPRITISKGTIIVTAVVGRVEATGSHAHGLPADGDLIAWRSTDGGKSWSNGVRINDVPAAAREGLHALASDGRGNLFAVWLDKRKDSTQLYSALSRDSGKTWAANVPVYKSPDGNVCECCHPSAAYSPDGKIQVMWRNNLDGARDFYLIQSKDGRKFSKPERIGEGTWKINGCPMDGGGLAHDARRTVTAWRRENDIYLAEAGKVETKLGEGKDVAIAASQGRIYVLWISGSQLEIWQGGKTETLPGGAAFPSITALSGGGVLAAWEENNGISIRQLP